MNGKERRYLPSGIAILCIIVTALIVATIFNNFGGIGEFINKINRILTPVALGVAFAFLLSPVYNRLIKRGINKYIADIICLVILLAAMFLLGLLIIPRLISSISSMIATLSSDEASFGGIVESLFPGDSGINATIKTLIIGINTSLKAWADGELLPNLVRYISTLSSGVYNIVSGLFNVFIGVVVMIYLLNIKESLIAQIKKVIYAVFNVDRANLIIKRCRYTKQVFMGFIIGKLIDSLIIGVLTFIVISIFDMPYKLLIATIVGVTNVIPFFGPFIGAIPCALLLLITSPKDCLWFIIIIFCIQQLDGNVIGPKILGSVTKISSFWVLFSILFLGGLFGIVGMIIAVPAFAVLYAIIRDHVDDALTRKKLPTGTGEYENLKEFSCVDGRLCPQQYTKADEECMIDLSAVKKKKVKAASVDQPEAPEGLKTDINCAENCDSRTDKNRKEN